MNLTEASRRAIAVRELYEQLETRRYGRAWNTEELALGMMGDMGDLAKLIQAHEGVRNIADADTKLAHELADCLWSVLVLADKCGVDIEAAFSRTMDELESHVAAQLRTS